MDTIIKLTSKEDLEKEVEELKKEITEYRDLLQQMQHYAGGTSQTTQTYFSWTAPTKIRNILGKYEDNLDDIGEVEN